MPWRRMGERRYSSYSNLTSALDGGEWSVSRPGRALPPGKGPPVPTGQEAGWAPESVWTQRLKEKSSAPVRDRTPIVQPVVRHYTAWATAAHVKEIGFQYSESIQVAQNMAQRGFLWTS
jgi:hypothetical protein